MIPLAIRTTEKRPGTGLAHCFPEPQAQDALHARRTRVYPSHVKPTRGLCGPPFIPSPEDL